MSVDPRAALSVLVTAFERHLEASSTRSGEDDSTVVAAYDALADAFEVYDGAVYDAFGEMTPLVTYTGDDGDDDEDGDYDDVTEDAGIYAGLDDDDVEYEDTPVTDGAPGIR
ncbi:MAG: primosomal protein [Dermatophilaceae bacterium]